MKTAIFVPDALFDEAEKFARKRGLNRSELYQLAIQKYLEAERADIVKEALDRVYGPKTGALDEATGRAQAEVLDREDW